MAGSNAAREGETHGRLRSIADAGIELLGYLIVLTLWTVGLTLLFLATAWPRWAFYATLLGGVVVFAGLHPGRFRE